MADALAAAHSEGVVHRDIKPANVRVLSSGRVKICDFGIAFLSDATSAITREAIGTPSYMAPEQIEDASVDGRTDLYALGCTLYHLLTGQPPFTAKSLVALLRKHLEHEPASVRSVHWNIPANLDELITELLAKAPDDRPSNATEVAARLRGASGPERAGHQSTGTAPASWANGAGTPGAAAGTSGRAAVPPPPPPPLPPYPTPVAAAPKLDQEPLVRAAAAIELSDPWDAAFLLEQLRESNLRAQIQVLLNRDPAAQVRLNHPGDVAFLIEELQKCGYRDQILTLLSRSPAEHVDIGNLRGVTRLIGALHRVRALNQVKVLEKRRRRNGRIML